MQRRLLDRKQQTFYLDDLSGEGALGAVGALALPYKTYQLALTAGNVAHVVSESAALVGGTHQFDPALLLSEGKYVERELNGEYWAQSGHTVFDATRFYLPVQAFDPYGGEASVEGLDEKQVIA